MFEIVLLAYLTYKNSIRAKLKGQNVAAWAVFTVLSFFVFMMIGAFVVIFGFSRNLIDMNLFSSLDPKMREAATAQLQQIMVEHPLYMITILVFAIGGYLLIRYLLDRYPDKKKPEVHWMDKLGGEGDA